MTSLKPSPLEALAGLLEERRRFEGWLKQLADRSAETPQHVVERVRADYSGRLEAVITQLRSRATELDSSAREFEDHSTALLGQVNARRDERAEAELRAAVGEFSAEEAHGILARCDEEIGRLSSEREEINTELSRIREVLNSVLQPARAPAPGVAAEAPQTPAPPAQQAAPTQAQPPQAQPPQAQPQQAQPQQAQPQQARSPQAQPQPAQPQPVQPQPAQPQPAQPPQAPQAPAPPPQGGPLHGTDPAAFDELAFLQSVVQPREGAPRAPAPDYAQGAAARRPAPAGEGGAQREVAGGSAGSRTAAATPEHLVSFLKDAPTEHVKTLKCQECGTMNYPTEWYCERCGGELAAM